MALIKAFNLHVPQLVSQRCHWHSLPVTALAWSPDGEHLFSGGGEAVLVKWRAADLRRDCLAPRLGGAIVSITASHSFVAAAFEDNTVKVFDHRLELVAHFSVAMGIDIKR